MSSASRKSTARRAAKDPEVADDDVLDTDDDESTEALRSDIEQTRAEMGQTIEAIKERLAPDNIKESVKEEVKEQLESAKEKIKETISEQYHDAKASVREATIGRVEHMMHSAGETVGEARETIVETVRRNPIPAALVGIGLGWLLMSARSQRRRSEWRHPPSFAGDRYDARNEYGYPRGLGGYGAWDERGGRNREQENGVIEKVKGAAGSVVHRAEGAASQVAHTAEELAHRAQHGASALAHRVEDTAHDLGHRARYGAQRIEHRVEETFQENPLALGALAVAVGAAVGLALPQTRRENELIGEARDQLVDKARDVAESALGKVEQAANDLGGGRKGENRQQQRT
jgi:ElaB/YqjD/DUF883 family membrane-anchored ribosome-binding protein